MKPGCRHSFLSLAFASLCFGAVLVETRDLRLAVIGSVAVFVIVRSL